MRGRQEKPARRARFAALAFERNQEIRADGEEFPDDEKMQSVRAQQHEAHVEEQAVPPRAARRRGGRMIFVRPIFAGIQSSRAANHREQNQKERAEAVEPQMQRLAADDKARLPVPSHAGGQHPHGGGERRDRAGERGRQPDARRFEGAEIPATSPMPAISSSQPGVMRRLPSGRDFPRRRRRRKFRRRPRCR